MIIYTFKNFLKQQFAFPVRKIPVHTFLGCPHRENRIGSGGCIYCENEGFSSVKPDLPDVLTQIKNGITYSRRRGFKGKYIAYFQTYTNTFANPDVLKSWFQSVLDFPDDIIGLSVSTRPDCLENVVIDHLSEISKLCMVWIELGLQSARDKTLKLINRGHDYACFEDAVKRIKRFSDLLVSTHIILGLPGESYSDMEFTISAINKLNLDGVKIHHLQVVKNTVLADWYSKGDVKVFSENEYINLLTELIPRLSPKISIHRLVGDIRDDMLIAPKWNLTKTQIIQLVEKGLKITGMYQGCLYSE